MPTNKIKENNNDIKNDYYQNIDLQEAIKNAKSLLERLNNGKYQGLVKIPILEPINLENGNKEGENKETEDSRKQKLLLNGFFAITPGLTLDNKLKHGGKFNKN